MASINNCIGVDEKKADLCVELEPAVGRQHHDRGWSKRIFGWQYDAKMI